MNITYEGAEKKTMGTWMKEIPPKMVHDKLGLYKGQWLPEMDRAWVRKEDGVSVYSRLMLLEQSDNRFHAKVSRMKRKDSMCFWVSRYSYFLLEKFFEEEKHVIAGTLLFIAYREKLGISRELATFDSHNSVQALLISRYFRTVENLADVDLGEMYSLMMQAWNGDLPDKHPLSEALRYERAQTILLLLDTMDLLTGKTVFTDDHFLLQENGCLWHALGMASSWEKAEKEYHAELQMKNSMLKNE